MGEKVGRKPTLHEISLKLVYLNGSFHSDELNTIFKWREEVTRRSANLNTSLRFDDYAKDLGPLRRERYRRGLLIIDEVLYASNPNRSIDDVLFARVIDDNGEWAVDDIHWVKNH